MIGKYPDEAAAFRAVDRQKAAEGIWTGIRRQEDGSYDLLYESDHGMVARHDRAAPPRQVEIPLADDSPPWNEDS
jgi:hypothetical protein